MCELGMAPNIMLAVISRGVRTFSVPEPSVHCRHDEHLPEMSAVGGVADVIGRKADIGERMSGFGGKADSPGGTPKSPLIAKTGHTAGQLDSWCRRRP